MAITKFKKIEKAFNADLLSALAVPKAFDREYFSQFIKSWCASHGFNEDTRKRLAEEFLWTVEDNAYYVNLDNPEKLTHTQFLVLRKKKIKG